MEESCSGFLAETKDGQHDAGRNRQNAYARRDLHAILFLHDRLNRPDAQNFLVPVVSELRLDQRRSPQDDQNDSGAGENLVGHARRVYHTGCPLEAASNKVQPIPRDGARRALFWKNDCTNNTENARFRRKTVIGGQHCAA